MSNNIQIDYDRLQLKDPYSFIEYGVEVHNHITENYGKIKKIIFVYGKNKSKQAKIKLSKFKEVTIETPDNKTDLAKLANLLWTLSKGCKIRSNILLFSKNDYDVTTKHKKNHAGKLQRKIKDCLENRL
ncbi:hypothetical protein GF374_02010 [Candidatus Woesearchaeota archaeon]|nr:hypothetical protein [Candidatus Woesearchaeota archaeon]